MTVSGSWRISGAISGLATGTRDVDVSITPTNAIDQTLTVACTTGFNAIAIPTGATAALIIPDPANAQTITLKGVTGDTGIPLSKTQPSVVTFGASPAMGLTVGGAVTVTVVFS